MLCLTRKTAESFWIGDDVQVIVLSIRGDRVEIGISAPQTIDIVRTELRDGWTSRRSPDAT